MNHFVGEYLEKIIPVAFTLDMKGEKQVIGNGEPAFLVRVKKDLNKGELLTSTSLALGEAYMRGDIETDKDLYEVLNLFLGQIGKFNADRHALKKLLFTAQTKKNQEREVTSHYDIGNDFYSLWLDETMSYSCGYFKEETDTLFRAQQNKVHHILQKLQLKEGMHLLDIGCGWGYLLLEAVKHYGVRGTGITLSKEQYKKCQEKITEEGLEGRLTVKLLDYRELEREGEQYDRIVSVGMIEHVGRGKYEEFFKNAAAALKPEGLFLLHYISAQKENPGDAFIKKYIFPGGVIPSLREIIHLLPEENFRVLDVESLRRHYNRTLLCWRENFLANRALIEKRFGEEFTRMWELYLTSCAASFQNGVVDLHQILMSKGVNNQLSMTRTV